MKIKIKDIRCLIVAVATLAVAMQLHYIFLRPTPANIQTKEIEEALEVMETNAENLLQNVQNDIQQGNLFMDVQDSVMLRKSNDEITLYDYTLLIYKNDTLRYWSDNSLQVPTVYDGDVFPERKISLISNAWYETISSTYEDYNLIALIKIKNDYAYKNQYLKSTYNKAFDIPEETAISPKPASGAVNINGKNGDIVFSLSYAKKTIPKETPGGLISILYIISLIFFLLFLTKVYKNLETKKYASPYLILMSIAILLLRWLMIKYKIPTSIYHFNIFNSQIYAGDGLFPRLGDFLINTLLIFFFAENFFRIFNLEKIIKKLISKDEKYIYLIAVILLTLNGLFIHLIEKLYLKLLFDSTISFDLFRIKEITTFSIVAYLILGILGSSFFLFTDKILKSLITPEKNKQLILATAVGMLPSILLFLIICNTPLVIIIGYIATIVAVLIASLIQKEYSVHTLMIFAGLISFFVVWFVSEKSEEKNKNKQKILATQLYDERDYLAELLIREIDTRLQTDTVLQTMIINTSPTHKLEIHDYLTRKYFYGYWDKYKLLITLCGNVGLYSEANQADYCEKYFTEVLKAYDKKLEDSEFYYINNPDGTITYFTSIPISSQIDKRNMTLYIQLLEKPTFNKIGYPELLIDENVNLNSIFDKYSYAKYNEGNLTARSGTFPYNLTQDAYIQKIEKQNSFFEEDGYLHYAYHFGNSNIIILSRKLPNILDYIVAFSYLFVFFFITMLLATLLINQKFLIKKLKPDFKNKIQFALITILAATFIIFIVGTIYYAVEQDKQGKKRNMTQAIQSVMIEMQSKFETKKHIEQNWTSQDYENLDELLIKYSNVFFIDINIYNTKGNLIGTSRSEIYQRKLLGKQINRKAFQVLANEKKNLFSQKENIGNFEYASIYAPFKNKDNKTIAYIQLPFFVQDQNLQNNISALLISTLNVYILFFLLSVFISVIIANSISYPLRMLQSKFKNIQLGQKHQEISYPKNDEIGELVKEYNRMNEELQESVCKLAESERESAWREMAKQIAHEIKNPLTPMKLSVQLLQRTWNNKDDNFGNRLKKISETLIEQIDTLSAIASEFSAFAKMPKAQNEEVDLIAKLGTVVQLFDNDRQTKINLETNNLEEVIILADKEQLSRVFINVIKNGIQAVPEGIAPKINVEITLYGNNVKVTIQDNGCGIPESKKDKLFKPSFTTKTKGMGMGLAIVKNIINNANGEIWFESEENKGTKFYIEFPLYKELT